MLCRWKLSTFYKVLFILILALTVIEYLFGGFIESRNWDTIIYRYPKENASSSLHALIKINKTDTRNSTTNITNFTPSLIVNDCHSINVTAQLKKWFSNTRNQSGTNNKPNTTRIPLCPEEPPNLRGRLEVVRYPIPIAGELESRFSWLKPGGHWFPDTCKVLKKVAIIVPYRYRGEHLLLFLQHMHPFLKRQQLDYNIYVVEQGGSGSFNRALLMNIGFIEASKLDSYDCFIFHDVDLIPEDDRNLYTCPEQPRHMSVAVDIFGYKLLYTTLIGGVTAITKEHFKLLNGFANSFWGWGGEDDDMYNRIRYHKLHISRYTINIARYTMLQHKKNIPNPNRHKILKFGPTKFTIDGLNNAKYEVKQIKKNLLYTWISVAINQPS